MPNQSGVWTLSQQFQARGQGLWPAPPGAPTIGTATAGTSLCASVTFTAPGCTGYPAGITSYTVTSTPGCITKTGASSPLVVTGLTGGTSYTFKVKATGTSGLTGICSAASNSITATVVTCSTYTNAGTYTWVAPAGVTSIAVVAVGGGGGGGGGGSNGLYYSSGGGGGALAYRNNVSVTPGNSYTVTVGAGGSGGTPQNLGGNGGNSQFCNGGIAEVRAGGGERGTSGGTPAVGGAVIFGAGGGAGGAAGKRNACGNPGGGGAGGYSGAGGAGGDSRSNGNAGSGGGGGGGGGGGFRQFCCGIEIFWGSGYGGGVGLYGQGSNGTAGAGSTISPGSNAGPGSGGSTVLYGAGAGSAAATYSPCTASWSYGCGPAGARGAVRIVWAGGSRGTPLFPSTCVGA